MILSVGEILSDMIGENKDGNTCFNAFCGGAPFNVAVNAKKAGAKVSFIGKVGNDPIGRFVYNEAKKADLDNLLIDFDNVRNTTIAFVTLKDGERDFAFYRHDTADFNIDIDKYDFNDFTDLNIVHLGSLMLSEKNGVKLAKKVVKKTKKAKKLLSFDLNFRTDIFKDYKCAKKSYKYFIDCADILKFSDDELKDYTGISDIEKAVKSLYNKDKIIVVTMCSKGSFYYYKGQSGVVDTVKVKPVDTTGAGDAFFGTFLAFIEGKELTSDIIKKALKKANKAGAETTQFLGAIKL